MSKMLVQKTDIDCESTIENGYFDNAKMIWKTEPRFDYCGVEGSNVLGLIKLWERYVTKGYNCFPICIECLDVEKKKVILKGGQDVIRGSSPYFAGFSNPDSLLYLLRDGSSR